MALFCFTTKLFPSLQRCGFSYPTYFYIPLFLRAVPPHLKFLVGKDSSPHSFVTTKKTSVKLSSWENLFSELERTKNEQNKIQILNSNLCPPPPTFLCTLLDEWTLKSFCSTDRKSTLILALQYKSELTVQSGTGIGVVRLQSVSVHFC